LIIEENVPTNEQIVEEKAEEQRVEEEMSSHGLDKLQIVSDKSEEGPKQEDFEQRIETQEGLSGDNEEFSRNAYSHPEPIVNQKSEEEILPCENNKVEPIELKESSNVDLSNTGLKDSVRSSLNNHHVNHVNKGKQPNVPQK